MEIYFGIVLALSALCLFWWALMCKVTGGFIAAFIYKVVPLILGISLMFMLFKGIGWV